MGTQPPALAAIVFDVDGVLIDSLDVKAQAFATVFAERPDLAGAITEHHLANGGVTRSVKLAYYFEIVYGRPPTDSELAERATAFGAAVEAGVVAAPEIPGATDALAHWSSRVPLHAVSATPNEELVRILTARGIVARFRTVQGWPPDKDEAIAALVAEHAYRPGACVLVGDSIHDLYAARAAGVHFVHVNSSPTGDLADADAVIRDLHGLTVAVQSLLLAEGE